MSHPTRAKQIERMMELLDSDKWDDISLRDLATHVVDSFHTYLGIKEEPMPVQLGMAFKIPWRTHALFMAWTDGQRAWLVTETSNFGWFAPLDHPIWLYAEESPDGRRPYKLVENPETGKKDKKVPIELGPRPGEPGNNPTYSVGDVLSLNQEAHKYQVIATGDKCALLESLDTGKIYPDSNANLDKYYRRRRKPVPAEEELL